MKPSLLLPLALAMALPGALYAQTPVYTAPVGFVSVTVPAASDAILAVPLNRASEFQGVIASIAANEITITGTPGWTANQFAPLVTSGKTYAIQIASGASEGLTAKITANTATSVTVQLDTGDSLTGVTNGDSLDIVPYWTPSSLFSTALPSGSRMLLYSGTVPGTNIAPSTTLQYNGTNWLNIQTLVNSNNSALKFGDAFVLRNSAATPTTVSMVGTVPMSSHRLLIRTLAANTAQDIRIGYMSPVPETLGQVGLGFASGDRLLAFNNAATGINKSPSTTLQFNGTNWLNIQTLQIVTNTYTLQPGNGYVYRRAATANPVTTAWNDLQSYLNP